MLRQTTFALLAAGATLAGLSLGCQREKPDALVNAAVMSRLEREPSLATSELHASTENGHVILMGEVSTDEQRKLAEHVADDVSGVKDVTNRISVAAITPPPVAAPPQEVPEQPVPEQQSPQPGTPPEGYPLTPSPPQD